MRIEITLEQEAILSRQQKLMAEALVAIAAIAEHIRLCAEDVKREFGL
jgi:hypothetical protein